MLKIGFIDYYLDEWHANNYPEFIRRATDGEMKVCYAYGMIDGRNGLMTNAQWAAKYGVELLDSIEAVIEKSDCLVVLSPDNPEMHEELCKLPLASGKRVYVDKTFAPSKAAALRIFENAEKSGTPCYSSSALRFSSELKDIDLSSIDRIYSEGPSSLSVYAIHQIEMIVRLMQTRAKDVMYLGDDAHPSYLIRFADGRAVQCCHRNDPEGSFCLTLVDRDNQAKIVKIESDYFGNFIQSMVRFFQTGEIPVSHEQTVDVIAVREAVIRAAETPFQWVSL